MRVTPMQRPDAKLLVEKTRPSTLPKKIIYILVRSRTSPKIVRRTFLLFVFTIPFDFIDLDALRGVASLTRLVGLLFFSTCLLFPKSCFRRPPQALWWFAGYVAIYVWNGLFLPKEYGDLFIDGFQTLIQLLVFCWIGSTLLQEDKLTRHALLAFSIATLLAATAMLLGLPGFVEMREGRLSTMGANPNGLAALMALTAQALIGLGIYHTLGNIWMRVTCMAMSLVPITAMVYTGSRGGMLAFLTGIVAYALPYSGSKRKMTAILGVAIAVVGVIYTVISDQTTLSRVESSYYKDETAGRDKLFAAAKEMIAEKPLLGWQPIVFNYELGARTGRRVVDAHNLFFHLLMEGGLVGATPFLIGLGLCMRAAWTARACSLGILPLVWLITMIVLSMSGTWLTAKLLWFVLALNLASEAFIVKQYKRNNMTLRTILQYSQKRHSAHTTEIG
jgi:O-antigen ligase